MEGKSLAEIVISLENNQNKQSANCLLAALVIYTENFKKNITAEIFQTASDLMKKGADLNEIVNNIYKKI